MGRAVAAALGSELDDCAVFAREGLTGERDALWARVGAAPFLTDEEKREAVGYGPRRGLDGDHLRRKQPSQHRDRKP